MQAIFCAIIKGDGTSRSQLCQDEQNKLADTHLILVKARHHCKYMTWTFFLNVHSEFSTSIACEATALERDRAALLLGGA